MLHNNKKGQVWLADYTLGLLLFVMAVLIAVKIVLNSFSGNTAFSEMKPDASKISEMLLSEGYPPSWNNSDVIRPGLLTGNRLNSTKIINAMNLSNFSYQGFRAMLQTKYDYMILFNDKDGCLIKFGNMSKIGGPGVAINNCTNGSLVPTLGNFTTISYHDLVRISRFAVYNSTIVQMVVYVWD